MAIQDTSPQAKGTAKVSMPKIKADIFASVAKGRRIHRVARSFRVDKAEIETILVAGIREMSGSAPLPSFRSCEMRDGWGKRKPMGGAVVIMQARREEAA